MEPHFCESKHEQNFCDLKLALLLPPALGLTLIIICISIYMWEIWINLWTSDSVSQWLWGIIGLSLEHLVPKVYLSCLNALVGATKLVEVSTDLILGFPLNLRVFYDVDSLLLKTHIYQQVAWPPMKSYYFSGDIFPYFIVIFWILILSFYNWKKRRSMTT